jgi:hypothetical protein
MKYRIYTNKKDDNDIASRASYEHSHLLLLPLFTCIGREVAGIHQYLFAIVEDLATPPRIMMPRVTA